MSSDECNIIPAFSRTLCHVQLPSFSTPWSANSFSWQRSIPNCWGSSSMWTSRMCRLTWSHMWRLFLGHLCICKVLCCEDDRKVPAVAQIGIQQQGLHKEEKYRCAKGRGEQKRDRWAHCADRRTAGGTHACGSVAGWPSPTHTKPLSK